MITDEMMTAAEPVAAMTTDYLGCEYVSMDVAGIEKIAAAGSKGPTEVVYLYAAPPAPSAQVQDVAGLERLRDVTFAVQHNPNCPAKYLVRLVGKSGRIDLKPYGNHFPSVKHETGDVLGFGKTLDEAIDNAIAAAAPAKQEVDTSPAA